MRQHKKLVEQIKGGHSDALRTLYLDYKDLLLTLANALLDDSVQSLSVTAA